jgi:hypothetical protein
MTSLAYLTPGSAQLADGRRSDRLTPGSAQLADGRRSDRLTPGSAQLADGRRSDRLTPGSAQLADGVLLRMIRNSNNNENHSYCKRFSIAITVRTIIILIENESQ